MVGVKIDLTLLGLLRHCGGQMEHGDALALAEFGQPTFGIVEVLRAELAQKLLLSLTHRGDLNAPRQRNHREGCVLPPALVAHQAENALGDSPRLLPVGRGGRQLDLVTQSHLIPRSSADVLLLTFALPPRVANAIDQLSQA